MIKDKNTLNDSYKNYAFVEFFDLEDAKKALDALGKGEIKLREEILNGNYSTKTEDKNNYIYDNNLEKKKNKGQKLVQFRSISQRIKGIKEKTQLLKLVSHYLFPFVEKAVYKKKYKNKKAEKERKLKLLNDKIERNRRFVSLDSNSNNYLRCSVLYNRPYEYNALELQKVNLKMNLDLI